MAVPGAVRPPRPIQLGGAADRSPYPLKGAREWLRTLTGNGSISIPQDLPPALDFAAPLDPRYVGQWPPVTNVGLKMIVIVTGGLAA
ncbi:hypothetical protein [Actinomadura rugatobispora]|uniref:Uncharacterized protein n=1 Tax=Actinomadura rugatobispora TaxID=1994 RepID=A0ABW0ZS03_9ACTN|nr:hypothetical protein GCM10010200_034630 [Actinomadura rugatobispora]